MIIGVDLYQLSTQRSFLVMFKHMNVGATMAAPKLLAALLLLVLVSLPADGKKLPRIKAGIVHKEHAPIHIVVNKVG